MVSGVGPFAMLRATTPEQRHQLPGQKKKYLPPLRYGQNTIPTSNLATTAKEIKCLPPHAAGPSQGFYAGTAEISNLLFLSQQYSFSYSIHLFKQVIRASLTPQRKTRPTAKRRRPGQRPEQRRF